MMQSYPVIATEKFDKANIWIKYVMLFVKSFIKGDVLEIGAGCGSFTRNYLNESIQSLTLQEYSKINFEKLTKKFEDFKNVKIINDNPLEKNNNFDTIIYFNVLEHIKEDKLEIENALNKLNNGGHLLILVPAHQRLYSKLDKAVGHYRRYNINFFKENKFENSKIIKLHFLDFFGYTLYFLNKIFFKEETYPTNFKIFVWDKIFTPVTIIIDFVTGYKFGKNILCIYRKIT